MRALQLTRLEYGVYLAAIASSVVYVILRLFVGQRLRYPKVYDSFDKNDFIIANLGELEMIATIISPALCGFALYDWSTGVMLPIIQVVACV